MSNGVSKRNHRSLLEYHSDLPSPNAPQQFVPLTCPVCDLHLQDLDADQSVQEPHHAVFAGFELGRDVTSAQRLLGVQQQVEHSQLTGREDHLSHGHKGERSVPGHAQTRSVR